MEYLVDRHLQMIVSWFFEDPFFCSVERLFARFHRVRRYFNLFFSVLALFSANSIEPRTQPTNTQRMRQFRLMNLHSWLEFVACPNIAPTNSHAGTRQVAKYGSFVQLDGLSDSLPVKETKHLEAKKREDEGWGCVPHNCKLKYHHLQWSTTILC
jgi:hypothetical protein